MDGLPAVRHLPLQMKRSTVVGENGDSVLDSIRTSYGMFIRCVREHGECRGQCRCAVH